MNIPGIMMKWRFSSNEISLGGAFTDLNISHHEPKLELSPGISLERGKIFRINWRHKAMASRPKNIVDVDNVARALLISAASVLISCWTSITTSALDASQRYQAQLRSYSISFFHIIALLHDMSQAFPCIQQIATTCQTSSVFEIRRYFRRAQICDKHKCPRFHWRCTFIFVKFDSPTWSKKANFDRRIRLSWIGWLGIT